MFGMTDAARGSRDLITAKPINGDGRLTTIDQSRKTGLMTLAIFNRSIGKTIDSKVTTGLLGLVRSRASTQRIMFV